MHFIDLQKQQSLIRERLEQRISAVLDHGAYIMGPEIDELEEKLAAYVGCAHCVTCASGTDALLMVLMAKGIGPGDAVITTPFTFIATAEVISLLGATPVFADIDPATCNLDPAALGAVAAALAAGEKPGPGSPEGLRPRAIIPVDLFGLPADYDAIHAVAKTYGMTVIEDAAQSFGAVYKGRKACSLAEIAATSFFPAKPLGCYGDGGAVFTDDATTAEVLRSLRVHGKGTDKYDNVRIGINGRLDTLQAAILLAKFELFPDEFQMRQKVAIRYTDALRNIVTTPTVPGEYTSAWAQYSVRTDGRERLMKKLSQQGIPTAIYYPTPLHCQKAFSFLGHDKGSFPVAEAVADTILSLPMHPYLTAAQQAQIIDAIAA